MTASRSGRPTAAGAPSGSAAVKSARWSVASRTPRSPSSDAARTASTESEHADGATRFAILKGGSAYRAEGSAWYVDGGPQPPDFSLKYLLAGPLQRSERIGFRLAVDL